MTKLHRKLSILVLGSLLVVSVPASVLVIRDTESRYREDLEFMGRTLAKLVAASCLEPLLVDDFPVIQSTISQTAQDCPTVASIAVRKGPGGVDADSPGVVRHPLKPSGIDPERVVAFRSPVEVTVEGYEPEHIGEVEVKLSKERYEELVDSTTLKLVAAALASFVTLALILAIWVRRSLIRPIRALEEHAGCIGSGDLDRTITVTTEDEIAVLASTMESMRVNLRDSYARIERQVHELQELDKLKDQFLANTSHEIKTPLNGIHGLTDSLLRGDLGDPSNAWIDALETIRACASRLRTLTDSILGFASDSASRTDTEEPTEQIVDQHVAESLVDLSATAERKGLRVRLDIPGELRAHYPKGAFEQILRNLVDNAVKFTERGGVEVIVRGRRDGGFQFAVRDTGPGVTDELRTRIFDPFVQGFRHENRQHGGVGLGLSIARNAAAKAAWDLTCDACPSGATFSVIAARTRDGDPSRELEPWPPMPVFEAAPEPEAPCHARKSAQREAPIPSAGSDKAVDANESGARRRLLIVDDEAINRKVLRLALQRDFDVIEAIGGQECLDTLETEQVDLLLLDIMMPEVSGYDVLREMRSSGKLSRVPVIVLSAKSAPEHIVRGLEMGALDYLGKPFHREELLTRIRTQLRLRDQTEQLEIEVESKSKALRIAREAVKVKSQFLANMSHEILTPLNGIYGYLNLAASDDAAGDREQQLEFLAGAKECARALLIVVNNILDVARIESKNLEITKLEETEVSSLIESVVESARSDADEQGLHLSFDDECSDLSIETDPSRLRDIVQNLVGNAIRFTETGWVRVSVSVSGDPDELEIRVADSGPGIDSSRHESIFEPFVQGDSSTTREHGGLGLGLSISRQFARLLGGEIHVESKVGRGSTFIVTLPCRLAQQTKVEPAMIQSVG